MSKRAPELPTAAYTIEAPYADQKELRGAIVTRAYTLEALDVTPTVHTQEIKDIQAAGDAQLLSLSSETRNGQLVAARVSVPSGGNFTYLGPDVDAWMHNRPGDRQTRYFDSHNVVYLLSGDMGPLPFGALMDTTQTAGTDVIHALVKHFQPRAKTRREVMTHSTIAVGNLDEHYAAGFTETSLATSKFNGRARKHRLGVSAVYDTSFSPGGLITKQYTYTTGTNLKSDRQSGGRAIISSPHIPRDVLAAYAEADKETSEPIPALHAGLDQLSNALLRQQMSVNE